MERDIAAVVDLKNAFVRHRAQMPRMHLLVAEKTVANQVLLQTILRNAGHRVDVASDDDAVMEAVSVQSLDGVFLDSRIYDESLGRTVKLLRAYLPAEERIPFVLVSSSMPFRSAKELAVDRILVRPLAVSNVLDCAAHIASRKGQPSPGPSPTLSADSNSLSALDFAVIASHLDGGVSKRMVLAMVDTTVEQLERLMRRLSRAPVPWRLKALSIDVGRMQVLAETIGARSRPAVPRMKRCRSARDWTGQPDCSRGCINTSGACALTLRRCRRLSTATNRARDSGDADDDTADAAGYSTTVASAMRPRTFANKRVL